MPDLPGDLASLIERAARAHGVDGDLLAAIATAQSPEWAEPCAPALMQLMPATLRRLGVADVLDPVQVIDAGARHLRGQIEAFDGDLDLAVAAYHAGPDAVRRHGGVPPYGRTQAFVPMVMAYLAEFRSAGAPGGVHGSTTDREPTTPDGGRLRPRCGGPATAPGGRSSPPDRRGSRPDR